jgi:hypothetical protein
VRRHHDEEKGLEKGEEEEVGSLVFLLEGAKRKKISEKGRPL